MTLTKENTLFEFLVNYPEIKDLKKILNSMDFRQVTNFLSDCDKLGSDIINNKNTMFDKKVVIVIIQIRKIAKSIGSKKLRVFLN